MKFYWLKLKDDFFAQKEIKKLRKIAGGDTFTIIYLKLQLLSLKNDGKLIFEGIEKDLASELALEIDEDLDNVTITLSFLQSHAMIEEIEADSYFLPKAIQNMGKEGDSAERVRRFRENQKALQSNEQVTISNTEIRDKRKEKREKIEENKEEIIDIIIYLNNSTNSRFATNNDKTIKLIQSRLNDGFTKEDFINVIDKKTLEWIKTDYAKYLRPETLFGNKFESYLNQKQVLKQNSISRLQDLYKEYEVIENE